MWVDTLCSPWGHLTWDRRCIKIRQGHDWLVFIVSITRARSLSFYFSSLSLSPLLFSASSAPNIEQWINSVSLVRINIYDLTWQERRVWESGWWLECILCFGYWSRIKFTLPRTKNSRSSRYTNGVQNSISYRGYNGRIMMREDQRLCVCVFFLLFLFNFRILKL